MIDVKRLRTAGTTVLAPISWGTTYVVITELLPAGRPLLVASARVVPAGLVLLAVGTLAGRRRRQSRQRRQPVEWGRTAVLALFNFGLFFPLLVAAVYRLPGGVAAAVGGLQPLLVAVVAWLVTGRRPPGREVAVGVAAVLGVALVVLRPGAAFDTVGVLAAVGANVSFSIGVVLTKRFPPADRLVATGWQLLLGGALLVPLTLVVEGLPPVPTGTALAGYTYLSVGATALAFVVWFNGVRRLPTAAPPLLGLAAPVTGAVLGWALLGQELAPLQLAGFALTLAAIAYGATIGSSPRSAGEVGQGIAGGRGAGLALEVGGEVGDVAAHRGQLVGQRLGLVGPAVVGDLVGDDPQPVAVGADVGPHEDHRGVVGGGAADDVAQRHQVAAQADRPDPADLGRVDAQLGRAAAGEALGGAAAGRRSGRGPGHQLVAADADQQPVEQLHPVAGLERSHRRTPHTHVPVGGIAVVTYGLLTPQLQQGAVAEPGGGHLLGEDGDVGFGQGDAGPRERGGERSADEGAAGSHGGAVGAFIAGPAVVDDAARRVEPADHRHLRHLAGGSLRRALPRRDRR